MENTNEIIITRIFDAPIKRLWKYFSDPQYFHTWWGPKGFTAPVIKMDFTEGGTYLNCMQDTEGKKYWTTGIYKEIKPLKKIVYTDSFSDENGNVVPSTYYGMEGFPLELEVVITFEPKDDQTKMTLTHSGVEMADEKMKKDMTQGWNESFDKLNTQVKK